MSGGWYNNREYLRFWSIITRDNKPLLQNILSLEQVDAVLNGNRVLVPPRDIAELKNAYEIYKRLDELDPYSVNDLLTAHGIIPHCSTLFLIPLIHYQLIYI